MKVIPKMESNEFARGAAQRESCDWLLPGN
jgi:hypothetical protein